MNQPDYTRSPCVGCTRTKDPAKCENKKCGTWQIWFIRSWNRIRELPWAEMDTRKQERIVQDPCVSCHVEEKPCRKPCRDRRVWLRKIQEV